MRILTDVHTHTNVSSHAYSTITENASVAASKGLELIAMTNHAPALPDSAHLWHFAASFPFPMEIEGVLVLKGAELNILDNKGSLDLNQGQLEYVDVCIASMHSPTYTPRAFDEHTETWMNVMKNPHVHILGHMGAEQYKCDYEKVVKEARDRNVCIEINNHSFNTRAGAAKNCREIALLCKKLGTNIVVTSDAHICYHIGEFSEAVKMLEDISFPVELIMNTTSERFMRYINM